MVCGEAPVCGRGVKAKESRGGTAPVERVGALQFSNRPHLILHQGTEPGESRHPWRRSPWREHRVRAFLMSDAPCKKTCQRSDTPPDLPHPGSPGLNLVMSFAACCKI